jgi:integrase
MPRVALKLTPKASGGFYARKRIPEDVREEYARQYGKSAEERLSIRPTDASSARREAQEWGAEIDTRFENIRAVRTGSGQPLSRKQALALAGEWYKWFVARYEEAPGDHRQWEGRWLSLLDELEELAPSAVRASANSGAVWAWIQTEEAAPLVRPIVADEAKTAQFLASRGLTLNNAARALFLDFVLVEFLEALKLLGRRAKNDYTPDHRPQRFPKLDLKRATPATDLTPWQLFEAWVNARQPAKSSVTRWRAVFLDLNKYFAGRTAGSLRDDEAHAWANQLITPKRKAATVSDVWVSAARRVWAWAVEQRKVSTNPFAGVKVTVPKKIHTRETQAFTDAEAKTILKAAYAIVDPGKSFSRSVQRWVPWLCAYTGARAGEMTQLRGKDVVQHDGVSAIRVTPDAGTVKTREPRTIPLHEHLVDQGFLKFAKSKGEGPLFYNAKGIKQSDDPTRPSRRRSVSALNHLGGWVRSLGVDDPAVKPNHGWRHSFKQIAARCDISERVSDYITGHAQTTVGRSYGAPTLRDMAEALKKFPRYELSQEEHEDGKEGNASRKKQSGKARS